MLCKNIFNKIIIITVIYMTINSTFIYATAEENISMKVTENETVSKVTDAEYLTIQKILEYINKEIKNIDDKIVLARKLIEYEKYPAVRLNIDTPYFGLNSIINSKLRIRNNVSTVDIASGYSIKDIINKKIVKVESFEVSNIIVITREVKIDKEMTSVDAQICISKLLDYLEQTKSVNKFVDRQLSSMIRGYYVKEKYEKILDINEQVKEIEENLNYSLLELSYIKAITENEINNEISDLYDYKKEITTIKNKVRSVLTSEEKLDEINENIVMLNDEIKMFRFNINKKYLNVINNIDLQKAVYLINSKMHKELSYLQKYIDNSKVEVISNKEEKNNESIDKDKIDKADVNATDSNKQNEEKEYEEVYKVTAEPIIESMKKDMDKAGQILDLVVKNSIVIEEDNEKNKNDDKDKEELDKKEIVTELLQIYIGFLNKEVVFLTENAKVNITNIKKLDELRISSFEDVEYIFINLSDILTSISDNFQSNSVISNIRTLERMKQVIDRVILSATNFKKETSIKPL